MACRQLFELCKRSDEVKLRGFNLTNFCARFWEAGAIVDADTVIRARPLSEGGVRGASGYQFRATVGGQSGEKEPNWKTGSTWRDGGVTWVREAIDDESLKRTIDSAGDVTWSAESPMTVTSPQLENTGGRVEIAALHGGGTDGSHHLIIAHVVFSDGSHEDFGINWEVDDS